MIEALIGSPGSGKTYHLTRRVMKAANGGRKCFVNWEMDYKNVYVYNDEEFLELQHRFPGEKKLIGIDEAHLMFDARMWKNIPAAMLKQLSQTRKSLFDMLWSSQDEGNVDKRLRVVTNWMWHCKAYFRSWNPCGDFPLYFSAACYEPRNFRKPKKHAVRYWFPFSKKVARAYDTLQVLDSASWLEGDGAKSPVNERLTLPAGTDVNAVVKELSAQLGIQGSSETIRRVLLGAVPA